MLFEFKNLNPEKNDDLDRSYNTDHIWSVTPNKNDRKMLTIFLQTSDHLYSTSNPRKTAITQ